MEIPAYTWRNGRRSKKPDGHPWEGMDSDYNRASSVESNAITCPYRSRRLDHGVHASARKLPNIADLNPVVPGERPEDIGVLVTCPPQTGPVLMLELDLE